MIQAIPYNLQYITICEFVTDKSHSQVSSYATAACKQNLDNISHVDNTLVLPYSVVKRPVSQACNTLFVSGTLQEDMLQTPRRLSRRIEHQHERLLMEPCNIVVATVLFKNLTPVASPHPLHVGLPLRALCIPHQPRQMAMAAGYRRMADVVKEHLRVKMQQQQQGGGEAVVSATDIENMFRDVRAGGVNGAA